MVAKKPSTEYPLLSLRRIGVPSVRTMKSILLLLALIAAWIGVLIPVLNSASVMFSVVLTLMITTFSLGICLFDR